MAPARSTYVVVFDLQAAQEFAELIKSKQERNAIINALDKLRQLSSTSDGSRPAARPKFGYPVEVFRVMGCQYG
jgi:hypothetical protein